MSNKTNTQAQEEIQVTKEVKSISLTKAQQKAYDELTTISAKIRYLASEGFSTKENKYGMIARFMNKRTQHVRNVLTQPLKKQG